MRHTENRKSSPKKIFSYRRQRRPGGNDMAFFECKGKRHYLGRYGSEESRERYYRKLAEIDASGGTRSVMRSDLSVVELTTEYMKWAGVYYVKDGRRATIGHSSSSGTYAWIDFEKQLVGVVFTQMPAPKNDTGGKKQRFWQLVREKVDAIFATPGKPASAEIPDHTPDSPD